MDLAHPGLAIAGILTLFAISALFSGTETALFVLRHDRRHDDARIEALLQQRSALLTTLLLGNIGANIALAAYGASLLHRLTPGSLWLNLVCLVPTIVLVAEVTPKKIAEAWPRQWAAIAYWPLRVFWTLVTPVRVAYAGLVNALVRALGGDPDRYREALGTAELLELVGSGAASGALDEHERDIIEAVFEFDDLRVERLMTPRTEMFAVPLTLPWEELVRRAHASGHSRIPVVGGRSDDVIGVLLLKDVLKHRRSPPAGPRQLRSLLLPTVFVPSSKSADAMLSDFIEKQFEMAFVVDEHGTLVGLVTLDDLLAELMGEMEEDRPPTEEESAPGGPWTLDGALDTEDFRDQTGIALPEGEYNTLAGFVFMHLGRLPDPGDDVVWEGWRFTVREMDGRRISSVEVARETA